MQLSVQEAARLLRVSTKTIYRLTGGGKLPGYRVQNQLRFDRAELVEWATARRVAVDQGFALDPEHHDEPVPTFDQALDAGGVHYRIEGNTRDEVLRSAAAALRLPDAEHRDLLCQALIAREDLASTAVGDGFALPHLRNPVRLDIRSPSVSLCFLEAPVDWLAPDGLPVTALFVVIGATVRTVLQLHSHTLFALRDLRFRSVVAEHGSREAIFIEARRVTAAFAPRV